MGGDAPERFRWIDHYVERIVCDLAGLLDLPAAAIQLADLDGERCSLTSGRKSWVKWMVDAGRR